MKLDKELKDILLGMEWCHAVRTNHLEEAIAKIKALVVESLPEEKKLYYETSAGLTSNLSYNQCLGEIRSNWE